MGKQKLPLCIAFAAGIHFFVILIFSVHVEAYPSPFFVAWLDILSKGDLFVAEAKVALPPVVFSTFTPSKKNYFSSLWPSERERSLSQPLFRVPLTRAHDRFPAPQASGTVREHVYLWERPVIFTTEAASRAQYKLFVSPQGKVVFCLPVHLPLDSRKGVFFQEYMRESLLFFPQEAGKFVWTKIEGIVQ